MRISLLAVVLCWLAPAAAADAQSLRLTPRLEAPTEAYDQVLARYAKPTGVDYAGLAADAEARKKLSVYLSWVAGMPETAPLSDWLNAYNALVLSSVLAKLPLASVMDDKGFFATHKHQVAGRARTLDEIENQIIRPRFHDARVHFALNCAARSCPALAGRAFDSKGLDDTLERLTQKALRSPQNVRLTDTNLELSAIFFWFEADFVRDAGSVRSFVRKYLEPAEAARVSDALPLKQRDYDWSLNRAP